MVRVTNNTVKFSNDFMLKLYALIRQIGLSIDRSEKSGIDALYSFLFSDNRIKDVYEKLTIKTEELEYHYYPVEKNTSFKFRVIDRFFYRNQLRNNEVKSLCFLLWKLILNKEKIDNGCNIITETSSLLKGFLDYQLLIENRISRINGIKGQKIIYFNQAKWLKLLKYEDL